MSPAEEQSGFKLAKWSSFKVCPAGTALTKLKAPGPTPPVVWQPLTPNPQASATAKDALDKEIIKTPIS
jgi:hypothetical protein